MREKTIEAMERRKERDRVKMRKKRAAMADAKRAELAAMPPAKGLGRKWLIGPRVPEMTKSELREMFAQAAKNTAAM